VSSPASFTVRLNAQVPSRHCCRTRARNFSFQGPSLPATFFPATTKRALQFGAPHPSLLCKLDLSPKGGEVLCSIVRFHPHPAACGSLPLPPAGEGTFFFFALCRSLLCKLIFFGHDGARPSNFGPPSPGCLTAVSFFRRAGVGTFHFLPPHPSLLPASSSSPKRGRGAFFQALFCLSGEREFFSARSRSGLNGVLLQC